MNEVAPVLIGVMLLQGRPYVPALPRHESLGACLGRKSMPGRSILQSQYSILILTVFRS